MNKTFKIDFDKLSKRDKTMLYEIIADYVVDHELPEDVATAPIVTGKQELIFH